MPRPQPKPPKDTKIVALIVYHDYRTDAGAFMFPQTSDLDADIKALQDLQYLARDPDGWLSYDPMPFVGTIKELEDIAKRFPIPGSTSGFYLSSVTPTEVLAVAKVVVGLATAAEPPYVVLREYVASGFNTPYAGAGAGAIEAAAPGFSKRSQKGVQVLLTPGSTNENPLFTL